MGTQGQAGPIRARVQATPVEARAQAPQAPQAAQGVRIRATPVEPQPTRMDGGGVAIRGRSSFDARQRGAGSMLQEVRLAGGTGPLDIRPRAVAQLDMGQAEQAKPEAAPAAPAWADVERIVARESESRGLTRKEASDLALALTTAADQSAAAIEAGERCVGVDDAAIADARAFRDRLARFAATAALDARYDQFTSAELALAERVLECGDLYAKLQESRQSGVMAWALGGLIVGTAVLIAVS